MEFLFILFLILLNGIFAMSEIAVLSSRKSKLQKLANDGDKKAKIALEISKSPGRFISTIQIGITLVGIFAGAFGEATIAQKLAGQIKSIPLIGQNSELIALGLVVSVITFLSLVIGELVPKKLALSHPEKLASLTAPMMNTLSRISGPIVTFLSSTTDFIFKIIRIKPSSEPTVSDEEVRILLREGTRSGVFESTEKDIVERTFKLSDKIVNTLMTPRKDIVWLDINNSPDELRSKIINNPHANFPVCDKSLDKVIGIVQSKIILNDYLKDKKIDLKKILHKPLFIPESMSGLKVLELFKKSGIHAALVIDEYGNVEGLLSLTAVLEEIVGDIPTINEKDDDEIVVRENGTFLVDGLVPIGEFKEYFKIKKLPREKSGDFHTIGGFVTKQIGRIPQTGDSFEIPGFRFEIVDMDGNRVDKILVASIDEIKSE
jgi:putative hemolysin